MQLYLIGVRKLVRAIDTVGVEAQMSPLTSLCFLLERRHPRMGNNTDLGLIRMAFVSSKSLRAPTPRAKNDIWNVKAELARGKSPFLFGGS
jgi:hypothetical protein